MKPLAVLFSFAVSAAAFPTATLAASITGLPIPILVPRGVSADGSVVVGGNGAQAVRWTAAGGILFLGLIPGTNVSGATAVSGDGSVVVGDSDLVVTTTTDQAFRWTAATGMVGLGFAPGDTGSALTAVSGDGSVAGGVGSFTGGQEAVIWDASHGMRSLKEVLTDEYGLDLTGSTLLGVIGISADGSTIVGYGSLQGGNGAAWIANIPPPVVPVQIEIEPFIPKDPINLNSPLPIPVAVLGSNTVDVTKIDVGTLRFGPSGATALSTQTVSVNGQVDLLAAFQVQNTGLAVGDATACLQGKINGELFQGCDGIVVFAQKCGLGFEPALILPVLFWLRNRRRHRRT